jgi:polyisoprenoid-binding protein YceI
MSNNVKVAGVVVLLVAVAGIGAFLWFTRPASEASEDIEENTERLAVEDAEAERVYRISQDESQVEFNIDEVLRGDDFTVVGTTNQVAGDIRLNFTDPSLSTVGQIRINARTFATDSRQRDGAIARNILLSERDEYEFIEFQPTRIAGLPSTANPGDELTFQITGDLTIKGVTQTVTFDTTATLNEANQLVGTAQTTILYADFGVTVPSPPFVSFIADEVILKINFVANEVLDES